MARMGAKQKPTPRYRIQTMTIADLEDGLDAARRRLNRRDVLHRNRKLATGPLINGLVAWYLAQTNDEQERIAREGLARYEAMLEGEETAPISQGMEVKGPAPARRKGRS